MRRLFVIGGIFILLVWSHFAFSIEIRLLKQWKHDFDLGGEVSHCMLDNDDNIILVHRPGITLVNEKQYVTFVKWGQGPNEINSIYGICEYKGDLAVFEHRNLLKLFERRENGYSEIRRKWLKPDTASYYHRDVFYYDGRFFLGGLVRISKQKNKLNGALLKIYNEIIGQTEKIMIPVQYPEPSYYEVIRKHFAVDGDRLFFMSQNEMKVYQISLRDLSLEKTIELEKPDFYIPMPRSFFIVETWKGDQNFWNDIVNWMSSYSSATRMTVLQGGYLVVQLRTCNNNLKKFALLFYNIENNFSLDEVIYLDDLLLAGKNDLLYCIHGGDPMVDENANQLIINVYQLNRKSIS